MTADDDDVASPVERPSYVDLAVATGTFPGRQPAFARYVDELGIKPQNTYADGLFVSGHGVAQRGGWFPQGLVRAPSGEVKLSDEAIGGHLSLVGLGASPSVALSPAMRGVWGRARGHLVEISPRGLGARRPGSFEDLDNHLVPGVARDGWCVVVRPDRTVLHDGPVAEVDRIVRESTALLGVAG
jgi:3-(3-hydroxy-phenyl)propionate hydroxylase